MAIFKRGNIWWVRFTAPDGCRIRRSTQTASRKDAQEFHDRLKAEYWRTEVLGDRPLRTWDDAAARWLEETAHKADHAKDAAKISWLATYLTGVPLARIDREVIGRLGAVKAGQASAATANRHLALVRAILRRAANEWEWLDKAPVVRLYPESKRRVRWLTRAEAAALLARLPKHQRAVARFALATGLRKANVLGLSWDQVDIVRRVAWVHPDQAKARKAIPVPLNADAMSAVREQMGKHERFVFTFKGRPVKEVNTRAWRWALQEAGVTDFRWHDLRHTWASWHVQAGTPLNALQELGGWESVEMVRRYAHLAPEHLAEHAARIAGGTSLTQSMCEEAVG